MNVLEQDTTPTQDGLQTQLDALIPPPTSAGKKLVLSVSLLALAATFAWANISGYLIPRPFDNSSWSSDRPFLVDGERGAVGAYVWLPNYSGRDVRITDVSFDAPGAELVHVDLVHEDTTAIDAGEPLPAILERDNNDTALRVWFKPTSCVDGDAPWGVVTVTMDFGDGALPPFSRTVRIGEDPVWDESNTPTAKVGDRYVNGAGPLALACEVLQ